MDATEVDLDRRWRLHPRVALRPEPFGALAYHYDNRRLNFLRSPDLVELVRSLENHETPRSAFDAHGIDDRRWPSFATALTALARSDFLQPMDEPSPHRPVGDRAVEPHEVPHSPPPIHLRETTGSTP